MFRRLLSTRETRNSFQLSPKETLVSSLQIVVIFLDYFHEKKKKNNSVIASSCSRIRIKLSFHMEPNRPWTYFSLQTSNMVHVSFIYNRENRLYRSVWWFLIVFVKIYRGSNKFGDIHLEKKKKGMKEKNYDVWFKKKYISKNW